MSVVHEVVKTVGRMLRPVRAGAEKLASRKLGGAESALLQITSSAFHAGQLLPKSATVDSRAAPMPPPLRWKGMPAAARSVVVLCEDPDAPFLRPFVHWMLFDVPAGDGALDAERLAAAKRGKNGKGELGFTGAAPPTGHGLHHYHFQVFALDTMLELREGSSREDLLAALKGHVLAWGDLAGTYARV